MSDLCDTFSLSNLVNGVTCVRSQNGTSTDVMLTNTPRSFYNSSVIETALSDCHKTTVSAFRAFIKKFPAKVKEYQNHRQACSFKNKKLRGNQAKCMTKELRRAIMDRSRLKNKYLKWPSRENVLAYKKAKNICNLLNKKAKKDFFKKARSDGVISNTNFWSTVKPFLTSKGFLHYDNISIDINGSIMEDGQKLAKVISNTNSYFKVI